MENGILGSPRYTFSIPEHNGFLCVRTHIVHIEKFPFVVASKIYSGIEYIVVAPLYT